MPGLRDGRRPVASRGGLRAVPRQNLAAVTFNGTAAAAAWAAVVKSEGGWLAAVVAVAATAFALGLGALAVRSGRRAA